MASRPVPPPPVSWPGRAPQQSAQTKPSVAQPAKTFSPIARPRAGADQGAGEKLRTLAGGSYRLEQGERHVLTPPNGVYNFVHVREQARAHTTMMSSRSGHAALAAGRPVLYAGTASFDQGHLQWWSNYSGTFQPIAEFHTQAGLPSDKFVPWQKLALGGVGLNRGMLQDTRNSSAPELATRKPTKPAKPQAASQPETAKSQSSGQNQTGAKASEKAAALLKRSP